MEVWVELKYGLKGQGITVCRLDHPYLLRAFKRCALQRAEQFAVQSEGANDVIHLHDELELERLQKLLDKLMPDSENGGRVE
jgi:hypothetical protein